MNESAPIAPLQGVDDPAWSTEVRNAVWGMRLDIAKEFKDVFQKDLDYLTGPPTRPSDVRMPAELPDAPP